jgi:hypothetical protein
MLPILVTNTQWDTICKNEGLLSEWVSEVCRLSFTKNFLTSLLSKLHWEVSNLQYHSYFQVITAVSIHRG